MQSALAPRPVYLGGSAKPRVSGSQHPTEPELPFSLSSRTAKALGSPAGERVPADTDLLLVTLLI